MRAEKRYGERHNSLIIEEVTRREKDQAGKTRTYVMAKCDCGITKELRIDGIVAGNIKTCGCSYDTYKSDNRAYGRILSTYKGNAKTRGFDFNLSEEQFYSLVKGDCHYCGIEPSRTFQYNGHKCAYNGIDRVDSSIGYESDNVVSCCAECNRAKSDLSYGEFLTWIERLVKFNGGLPQTIS